MRSDKCLAYRHSLEVIPQQGLGAHLISALLFGAEKRIFVGWEWRNMHRSSFFFFSHSLSRVKFPSCEVGGKWEWFDKLWKKMRCICPPSILPATPAASRSNAGYTFSSNHNIHKSLCGLCFWHCRSFNQYILIKSID